MTWVKVFFYNKKYKHLEQVDHANSAMWAQNRSFWEK